MRIAPSEQGSNGNPVEFNLNDHCPVMQKPHKVSERILTAECTLLPCSTQSQPLFLEALVNISLMFRDSVSSLAFLACLPPFTVLLSTLLFSKERHGQH